MAIGIIIKSIIVGAVALYFLAGIRIVRPTHKGIIETMGKFSRIAESGFNYVFPFFQQLYQVDLTEDMVDAKPQQIITKDKLNARVDAQIYFKVKNDDESIKNSQYKVNNYYVQIVQLARTTLRNIIGTMTLNQANSERNKINDKLMEVLTKETKNWGIDVVRAELKEIDPPEDVQAAMNNVVKAENVKQAATDYASAAETEADGKKRAAIKEAEGVKQAAILKAEGEAKSIQLVNQSASKYFKGAARDLKRLEVAQASLENNTKIVFTQKGISPTLVLDGHIVPIKK